MYLSTRDFFSLLVQGNSLIFYFFGVDQHLSFFPGSTKYLQTREKGKTERLILKKRRDITLKI